MPIEHFLLYLWMVTVWPCIRSWADRTHGTPLRCFSTGCRRMASPRTERS